MIVSLGVVSCHKVEVDPLIDGRDVKQVYLRIKNNNLATTPIDNLTVVLATDDNIVDKVFVFENVVFDANNEFRRSIVVPLTSASITVLGNNVGNTNVPANEFEGMKLEDVFLTTANMPKAPVGYFDEPANVYIGSSELKFSNDEIANVSLSISRVISKIVVQLAPSLDFNANEGKGFRVEESPAPINISGIDSMFILETPVGVNLPLTSYYDADNFGFDKIVKPVLFDKIAATNMYTDSIHVFPQINSTTLPYIILSVRGWADVKPFGGVYPPRYYGMRIKDVELNGAPTSISSLPRNAIITVTIENFRGNGYTKLPNPDQLGNVEALISVKSWGDKFSDSGSMQ